MRFSLIQYLKCDWRRNSGNHKGLLLVTHFRIANWLCHGSSTRKLIGIPYLVYYKILIEWILGFEVPGSSIVGKGLMIHHGHSVVVNPGAKIGKNCCILHGVTVGTRKRGPGSECPVIGNNVTLSAGVMVLGGVSVGDHADIGAGTMVLKDVEPYSVVVGSPQRVVGKSSRS